MSGRPESLPPSRGNTRNSMNQSQTTSTNSWEDVTNGDYQVGKLLYNTKNVLGMGCEGTKVFKSVL